MNASMTHLVKYKSAEKHLIVFIQDTFVKNDKWLVNGKYKVIIIVLIVSLQEIISGLMKFFLQSKHSTTLHINN